MIEKASEATDGYELADYLGRDEANAEGVNAMLSEVVVEYPRGTTYCTLSESGLPESWTIARVRWGSDHAGVEVTLMDETDDPQTDGGRTLDRTREFRYQP